MRLNGLNEHKNIYTEAKTKSKTWCWRASGGKNYKDKTAGRAFELQKWRSIGRRRVDGGRRRVRSVQCCQTGVLEKRVLTSFRGTNNVFITVTVGVITGKKSKIKTTKIGFVEHYNTYLYLVPIHPRKVPAVFLKLINIIIGFSQWCMVWVYPKRYFLFSNNQHKYLL